LFLYEGIFRKPRLWSNRELKKIAHLFKGSVVNVSAWKDYDKSVKYKDYIFGDYDSGELYRSYFVNAEKYTITNHPNCRKGNGGSESITLDLEKELPREFENKFDVVFNHTVLEHIFDVFKAFENLCHMSKDVVILVAPFIQKVHYSEEYGDYWRFTPQALDQMFKRNGFTVLHRSSSNLFQSSIYYFYVASRHPEKWSHLFQVKDINEQLGRINTGNNVFIFGTLHLKLEMLIRKLLGFLKIKNN